MKRIIHINICLFIVITINYGTACAQEVISTAGGHFTNSSYQLSWTLGEPITETVGNGDKILTQGMQQTTITVTTINQLKKLKMDMTVFPNPASEFVTLKIDAIDKKSGHKSKELTFWLYDINGKLLLNKNIEGSETIIPMNTYNPSAYILKVLNNKNTELKSFKIIKKTHNK